MTVEPRSSQTDATVRPLPFDQIPDWAEKLIAAGTHDYPRVVRRRLRIMNMVAYLIAFFTLIYALQYTAMGFTQYWIMVVINLAIVVLALCVPLLHRINDIIGGLTLIGAEFVALFLFTDLLGKASGVHLQYFAFAAAPFVVLGVERMRLAFAIVALAFACHILIWIYFPVEGGRLSVDPAVLQGAYVTAAATTIGLIAVTVFYAFCSAERARVQADTLLANALPTSVIERLKDAPGQRIADRHEEASVLFADIVGFTPLSRTLDPEELVVFLNAIVLELDLAAARHGIEKIKTIGDSYMALCGAPVPRADHTARMADFALEIREIIHRVSQEQGHEVDVRIGIAAGPVLAGIIGSQKFSYDVWGDTVNVASRMESSAPNGAIQVNEAVHDKLAARYNLENRGTNEVKGLGPLSTWTLIGKSVGVAGGIRS